MGNNTEAVRPRGVRVYPRGVPHQMLSVPVRGAAVDYPQATEWSRGSDGALLVTADREPVAVWAPSTWDHAEIFTATTESKEQ